MKFSAILLMGGSGERFGHSTPKQFLELGSLLVYEHALHTLIRSGFFDEIILVSEPSFSKKEVLLPTAIMQQGGSILSEKQVTVIEGGKTRQESSYKGLKACNHSTDYVLIHDAVRPFLSEKLIEKHVEAVMKYGAVNTCIPSCDAVNQVKQGKVQSIFERGQCMLGQTPQTFSYGLILDAHQKTSETNSVDDCYLVKKLGHEIHILMGEEKNFKITTPLDLEFARHLLYTQQN